ncbi:MAG: hypothetical protein IJX63_06445 [Lachnospiraceae bacterium]|nr:hypothetical protein [Lachnospiraceae bacterium]
MVVGTVLSVLGIAMVQGFGERMGSMLSEKTVEYVQKVIQNKQHGVKEDIEIPEDVKIEIEDKLIEYLKGLAKPVRIGGVAYFFYENIIEEEQQMLNEKFEELWDAEEYEIITMMESWRVFDRMILINKETQGELIDEEFDDDMAREVAKMINEEIGRDVVESYVFY